MNQEDLNEMFIVGFRLNYSNEAPEIYTIIIYEEKDKAVTEDNNLLFVTDITKIELIYSILESEIKEKYEMPTEVEMNIDIAYTLYLLENENADNSSIILNCLNMIFDLFNSIELVIPDDKRKILYGLADYLTFADDFPNYLKTSSISKDTVIEHIVWCLGKLLTRSKVL